METFDYVVKRDDIYVGCVSPIKKEKIKIHPEGIYDLELSTEENIYQGFDNCKFLIEGKSKILYGNGCEYDIFKRSMLFVLDENKCANDLLYNSPHYPIFNISSDEECLNATIGISTYVYQMGKFLKFFGYQEELMYEDIVEIKNRFFGDFMIDNCELLGRYETERESSGYETFDAYGNHRTFNLRKRDSVLPICYLYMLWNTRSYSGDDMFIPHELEGPIKSLKR